VAAHKLAQQRKHSGGFSNVLGVGGGASQKAWSKPAGEESEGEGGRRRRRRSRKRRRTIPFKKKLTISILY